MEGTPFYFDIRFWAFTLWAVVVLVGVMLLKYFGNECEVYLTIMCVCQLVIQAILYVFIKAFKD